MASEERGASASRHPVDPVRAAGPAAHDPEQRHPAAGPQPVAGDRLMRVFRAGRQMPAAIADEAGQRQLVEPHERRAQDPAGRLGPRARPVAGSCNLAAHRPHRLPAAPTIAGTETVAACHNTATSIASVAVRNPLRMALALASSRSGFGARTRGKPGLSCQQPHRCSAMHQQTASHRDSDRRANVLSRRQRCDAAYPLAPDTRCANKPDGSQLVVGRQHIPLIAALHSAHGASAR